MNLDRRSFRLGVSAGLILFAGLIAGLLFAARFDWIAGSHAQESARLPLPAGASPPNFVPVVKAVTPAVVNIATTRTIKRGAGEGQSPFMDDPFFRHFFGDEFSRRFQIPKERRENSLGSGVIVDADGTIVTNNHVVAKADEIKVLLNDKREFTGKVIGTDPKSDIAVIKINARNLPTIPWGDSDKLDVGEYVLAIGNPFALNSTVTMGIVSAVGRANVGIADYEDFIQTDAAINPGNSGGALVNGRGELVGINTAIFSRSGGYMGIGFAVPANMTRSVMNSLIKSGKVVRGYLGVQIQPVTAELAKQFALKEARGALVSDVVADAPASKAGMQVGDVIVAFNGKAIDGPATLRNTVAATEVGRAVKIEVLRDGKSQTVEARVAELPKDMAMAGEEGSTGGDGKGTALAGIEVRNLTPEIAGQLNLPKGTAGVVVQAITPDGPAASSDLQPGDVIIQINRQAVSNVADFRRLSAKVGKKDSVMLRVVRNGGKLFIVIKP